MPISFTQAALGAKLTVPTIDAAGDGEQQITVKAGTQHGQLVRLPGQGLPNLRTGQRGDMIVALTIEIPTRLSEKQRELLRDFAETENRDVMPESTGFWEKIKAYLS